MAVVSAATNYTGSVVLFSAQFAGFPLKPAPAVSSGTTFASTGYRSTRRQKTNQSMHIYDAEDGQNALNPSFP